MTTLAIIFWVSAFIVFYTYLGYGIVLFIAVKLKELLHKPVKLELPTNLPEVTLLIAAYNEELIIGQKMSNCRKLDYPSGKLKIVWVTDGSNDSTNELLKAYDDATVLFSPERKGKSAAVTRAMDFVTTPIVVFTDANTILNEGAICEMVKFFQDETVGCVAGEKRILNDAEEGSANSTEGIYWKYESKLKEWDYRLYSAVGAAGELFALRRELFTALPDDTLLDDFMLSMKIAMRGYRIAYCKDAYAIESASANMKEEGKRKVRIAAGGLQSIERLAPLLNPFKYGTLSWQYTSHRVLRWSLTPVLLFLLFPLNLILVFFSTHSIFYFITFAPQLLFYICSIIGSLAAKRGLKLSLVYIPYYFVFMNVNVFKGIGYLCKNRGKGTWEKAARK